MVQIKEGAKIENPRKYAPSVVEHLRHLLASGNLSQRDPRRESFYEVEGNDESYYIHISPFSGNVVLVAKWLRQSEDCCLSSAHLVA